MCRSIKTLHNFEPPATEEEILAAARQYVRKISGMTRPAKVNEAAFEQAIDEITAASHRLLASLISNSAPKNREEEAAKARARWEKRAAAG